MTALAILLIGFSLFSGLSLACTHFTTHNYPDQNATRWLGLALLMTLGVLQAAHFAWLYGNLTWPQSLLYRMTLFAVAPAFFGYSQPLLSPLARYKRLHAAHALPVLLCPWLPSAWAMPVAFWVGAVYLLWLAHRLYRFRQARSHFKKEMLLLGVVFVIAMVVSVLGMQAQRLPDKLFYSLYACAIGTAFVLVQITLGLRPQLSSEVQEAAQTGYASTTLARVDCDASLRQLQQLMDGEHLYTDPELSLPTLAHRLELSTHQLSELLNARLGKGFSRYLRELRVTAAKHMLIHEPAASVLSVGLNVGFTSQSSFYEAFREIEGMPPGQYRKLHLPQRASRAPTTLPE